MDLRGDREGRPPHRCSIDGTGYPGWSTAPDTWCRGRGYRAMRGGFKTIRVMNHSCVGALSLAASGRGECQFQVVMVAAATTAGLGRKPSRNSTSVTATFRSKPGVSNPCSSKPPSTSSSKRNGCTILSFPPSRRTVPSSSRTMLRTWAAGSMIRAGIAPK
jgi:hypothetical protein